MNEAIINDLYDKIADELNVSESVFRSAETSYLALGNYLSNHLTDFKVEVFPQGSMNLGTLIKPLSDDGDYDLDMVCLIHHEFSQPRDLKNIVGDALKSSERYSKMLSQKEGKRCWTLNYSDDSHFHMDILPSSPNNDRDLSIKITNKENNCYSYKISNPKGYAKWFNKIQEEERMKIHSSKKKIFSNSVEELKNYEIRTNLQKAIQILKRHRDIKYKDLSDKEKENKPISIIITTLAAKLYSPGDTIFDIIAKFASNYQQCISTDNNGNFVIENPVNNEENFADKWIIHPERKNAFFDWVNSVRKDLLTNPILVSEDFITKASYLKTIFGDSSINNIVKGMAKNNEKYITTNNTATLTTDKTNLKIGAHTFYGK